MLSMTNRRLGIGIPLSFPMVPSPFFHTFVRLEKMDFDYIPSTGGPIEEMRNDIVEQARLINCTHLIMMDTDMMYHPKTITRLFSLVNAERPVVGALCWKRYPPFDPLMFKGEPNSYDIIEEWEDGELVEVDATGTGCLMFHMSIFDVVQKPWFEFIRNPDPKTGGTIGEDIGFCWKVRKAGVKIFVDTSIESDHLSTMLVNKKTWKLYSTLKKIQLKNRGGDAEEIDDKCVN